MRILPIAGQWSIRIDPTQQVWAIESRLDSGTSQRKGMKTQFFDPSSGLRDNTRQRSYEGSLGNYSIPFPSEPLN
jgi:hypothetical protein